MKQNKGITLVALVITIIVLVILVGVSVAVAINTGLIANSKTAVSDYDNAQKAEETQIQNVTDLVEQYNGTAPRTIAELYDGINDPEAESYNENAMHIGDYVNYTAGTWSETKATPVEETAFTFGGYTAGQSRDTNATGIETKEGTIYQGWRIWDISEDEKTITLISAGCPEAYYHFYEENSAYNTEKILTGTTTGTLNDTISSTPREWNVDYVNKSQYGSNARALTKVDLDTWCAKYLDNTISSSDVVYFPKYKSKKFISLVSNNQSYWYATPSAEDSDMGIIWYMHANGVMIVGDSGADFVARSSCISNTRF